MDFDPLKLVKVYDLRKTFTVPCCFRFCSAKNGKRYYSTLHLDDIFIQIVAHNKIFRIENLTRENTIYCRLANAERILLITLLFKPQWTLEPSCFNTVFLPVTATHQNP